MPKKRVMVIDDDVVLAEEIKDYLLSHGYEVIVMNDPKALPGRIWDYAPQVILLDLNMPFKNGFDIISELRYGKQGILADIIVMAGSYKPSYGQIFKLYGIDKCLQKPFAPEDLLRVIEDH